MAEYRAIRAEEWPEAMELWTSVFNVPAWLFQSLNDTTGNRKLEHTRVAVEDGRIVSAVDVFLRWLRGIDGHPILVGGIGSVATLPQARQRGHSGKLLLDAIEVMKREGCAWSLLGTGVPNHYARYGWRPTPSRQIRGTLATAPICRGDERLAPLGVDGKWPITGMAPLYAEFTKAQPLAHVRTDRCWEVATLIRLVQPNQRGWGISVDGRLAGYLLASIEGDGPAIHEICADPASPEVLGPLFEEFRRSALELGLRTVTVALPGDSRLIPWIHALLEEPEPIQSDGPMSRVISDEFSDEALDAMRAHPCAHAYWLDAF